MRTRTYYRGPAAVVTSEVFVWRTTPEKVFAIRGLRDVDIVRDDFRALRPTTVHVAGGSLVLVAATWPVWERPDLVALGVLVAAITGAVAAAARWRTRPRRWAIRATYRGVPTVLFVSLDTQEFHQISRALRRSVEASRPDWPSTDRKVASRDACSQSARWHLER